MSKASECCDSIEHLKDIRGVDKDKFDWCQRCGGPNDITCGSCVWCGAELEESKNFDNELIEG